MKNKFSMTTIQFIMENFDDKEKNMNASICHGNFDDKKKNLEIFNASNAIYLSQCEKKTMITFNNY